MLFHRLQLLSAAQHGLLLRSQLAELGLSRHQVQHLRTRGFVEWASPTVLRVCGVPRTLAQRRLLAVLDADPRGSLSHLTAARVWQMQRRSEGRLHVIHERNDFHRRRPHLAIVHTTRRLPADHVVRVDGIATTTPARTIVDLANTEPLGRVARMLDNAWGHRLVTLGELAAVVRDVRSRGRRGIAMLDMLIEERKGLRPLESGLERSFADILRRAGELPLRRQVDLGDEDGWICRADFVDDHSPLVVFIDGDAFHRALLDRRHDDSQTRRLVAAGYTVVRFSDTEVLYEPRTVLLRVRRLRLAAA